MPVLVDEMFELFARMKREGVTILLVEQNVARALSISDRAYILDQGEVVHEGQAAQLLAEQMEGVITDGGNQPLGLEVMQQIGRDVEQLYDALDQRELSAGSPQARRLFS